MSMVVNVMALVAASVLIVAKIGPAHGVQISPSAMPTIKPLVNSVFMYEDVVSSVLPIRAMRLVSMVNACSSDGMIMVRPKKIMTIRAIERNTSGDMPVMRIMLVSVRVKIEKLMISPVIMPSGL